MNNYKNKIKQIFPNQVDIYYTIFVFYFLFSTISFAQNALDNLNYQYSSTNNRLNYITDAVSATTSTDDIDNQANDNYSYNAIGELSKDEAEGILEILWNSAGKVKQVSIDGNNDNVADRKLEFKYDALGYRMKKIESDLTTHNPQLTTYYARNAIGEVISIYQDNGSTNQRIETTIAGIGTDKITSATSASGVYSRSIGEKNYELKDHLGNVRVTISDTKEPNPSLTAYSPQLTTSSDYYSYGMLMPGRDYNSTSFRYGFNGKEKDNELKGNGCSYDFGARMLDPRVGRWLSTDPMEMKFADKTPYNAMANNPIVLTDPNGEEPRYAAGNSHTVGGGHVEIKREEYRVDWTEPNANSDGGIHINQKGTNNHWWFESIKELQADKNIPKTVRENPEIIKRAQKGLRNLSEMRKLRGIRRGADEVGSSMLMPIAVYVVTGCSEDAIDVANPLANTMDAYKQDGDIGTAILQDIKDNTGITFAKIMGEAVYDTFEASAPDNVRCSVGNVSGTQAEQAEVDRACGTVKPLNPSQSRAVDATIDNIIQEQGSQQSLPVASDDDW